MVVQRQAATVLCFACGGQVQAGQATCPQCGHALPDESIIQGHWSPPAGPAELPVVPAAPSLPVLQPAAASSAAPAPAPRRLDRMGGFCLCVGLSLAAAAAAVPAARFVFSYQTIIIHELGHAVFGWLFGYASVPAFDFREEA